MPRWPSVMKHLCQLCDKRIGKFSGARKMFVCEDCLQAFGRQEIAFARSVVKGDWISEYVTSNHKLGGY